MEIIAILMVIIIFILLNQKISGLRNEIDYLNTKIKHLRDDLEKITSNESKPRETKVEQTIDEKSKIVTNSEPELKPQQIVYTSKKVELETFKPVESFPEYEPQETFIDKTIEFLKENFLTVIGIITLVLGIGYFVKYAIDQNWINETFRVIIGIFIGLGIIGIGHYLRKKYDVFSSILVGGGISVLYFTITIAFREYALFDQNFAFILLALVTLLSIILSFIYNQQVLFIFSILGGFAAPLMISTGESNYVFLFTYLLILNLGTLYILWRKQWFYPGAISFALSIIFLGSWVTDPSSKIMFLFLGVFFILFLVYAMLPVFTKRKMDVSHQILYVSNVIVFTVLGIFTYTHYYADFQSLVPVILMFIDLGIYFIYKDNDKILADTSLALTIALITLSIGIEFETSVITALWAVLSSVLLFLWKQSKNSIFKASFIALIPIFFISLIINWLRYVLDLEDYPILFNPVFITSGFVFICSLINIYLIKDFDENEKFLSFEIHKAKNLFSIISILFIYLGFLFEIIYQTEKHFTLNIICGIAFLYSIYFISIVLLVSKAFNINTITKYYVGIINFVLMILYPIIILIADEIIIHQKPISYYLIYILYIIPFIYFTIRFLNKNEFKDLKQSLFSQWFVFVATVFIISFEIYNAYIIGFTGVKDFEAFNKHIDIYSMIILPIVWAILGCIVIYFGFKKNEKNLPIMGFALFGLIILKLYAVDVWQMSNIFRIISFTILGILILITSFIYQKLKKVMIDLFDQNEK
ncbi:MAG: DUF2339 domain-containing protein [Weeksellaceae bacterium]|nr:DUF2339 domain-containing protein [Weeksellaceae bacterium]